MRKTPTGRPAGALPIDELAAARRDGASWPALERRMQLRGVAVTHHTIRRRVLAVDPTLVSVRAKSEPSM